MRCINCQERSVIDLRRHNSSFCKPHFLSYFDSQVEKAIRRKRMMGPDDRVLVAVSGGKDSLVLWDLLSRLGYDVTGLHIHLGIGEYSESSHEKTANFAKQRGLELVVVDLAETYGMGIPELSVNTGRVACSGCGLSKRYVMNREAVEREFDVLATGHNLDDEAATLFGNVLRWQTGYLARQSPVLEASPSAGPALVKKVKPLYTLTERETAAYALLSGIDYESEECPNALGATSIRYKEVLAALELESPGTKHNFLLQFIERVQPKLETVDTDDHELRECDQCGQATTAEVCSFCRMWDRARDNVAEGRSPHPARRRRRRKPIEINPST
jgi:uncharacterized protein (TIGR00269 family)